MDFPDLMNGAFELLGAVAILGHVAKVFKDKAVAGVSIWSTVFFASWGFWNLYYYPHLGQWASFAGGIAIVLGNCLWIGGMAYYIRHPKDKFEGTGTERESFHPLAEAQATGLGCSPPPRCDECGRRWTDAIALAERNIALRRLVKKKTQYASLLEEELTELIVWSYDRGWRSTRVMRGAGMREEIAQLETVLGISSEA